jgi:ferric-dicitrate binding protein FerR (iron transport regulator)
MKSNKHIAWHTMAKYLSGNAPDRNDDMLADEAGAEELAACKETWKILNKMQEMEQYDTDKAWNSLFGRLNKEELVNREVQPVKRVKFRWSYAVAASLVLLMGLAGFLFLQNQQSGISYMNNNVAALTIFLPDGTEVSLNQGAEVKYNKSFGLTDRSISLAGEAFFKVKPNKTLPFIITTQETAVKVLGTSFNVKSDAQGVEVVVKTGRVEVYRDENTHEALVLNPGEGAFSSGAGLVRYQNERENYLAWLDKKLVFKAMPLPQVINDINQAYHTHIELGDSSIQNLVITTTFENNSIDEILESIALALNLEVEKQNKKYLLVSK